MFSYKKDRCIAYYSAFGLKSYNLFLIKKKNSFLETHHKACFSKSNFQLLLQFMIVWDSVYFELRTKWYEVKDTSVNTLEALWICLWGATNSDD